MSTELGVDVLRVALSASEMGVFELDAKTTQLRLDGPCAALLGLDSRVHELDAFLSRVQGDDRARLRQRLSSIEAQVAGDADLRDEFDWALPPDGGTCRVELRGDSCSIGRVSVRASSARCAWSPRSDARTGSATSGSRSWPAPCCSARCSSASWRTICARRSRE